MLRNAAALDGRAIVALDGRLGPDEIGHATDFFVEGAAWRIRYVPVDTINWWPGRKVLISPDSIGGIDWTNRLVDLNVDRQAAAESPPYNATVTLDRFYARHCHSDYGAVRPSHLR